MHQRKYFDTLSFFAESGPDEYKRAKLIVTGWVNCGRWIIGTVEFMLKDLWGHDGPHFYFGPRLSQTVQLRLLGRPVCFMAVYFEYGSFLHVGLLSLIDLPWAVELVRRFCLKSTTVYFVSFLKKFRWTIFIDNWAYNRRKLSPSAYLDSPL